MSDPIFDIDDMEPAVDPELDGPFIPQASVPGEPPLVDDELLGE